MSIDPLYQGYRVPGIDLTYGIKFAKTASYRVKKTFHVGYEGTTLNEGDILYRMGVDEFVYVDEEHFARRLDLKRLRPAVGHGWLEAIPAVPYKKHLPRTRLERIVDDSFDVCPRSSVG
jgi:hypothetical protein